MVKESFTNTFEPRLIEIFLPYWKKVTYSSEAFTVKVRSISLEKKKQIIIKMKIN